MNAKFEGVNAQFERVNAKLDAKKPATFWQMVGAVYGGVAVSAAIVFGILFLARESLPIVMTGEQIAEIAIEAVILHQAVKAGNAGPDAVPGIQEP